MEHTLGLIRRAHQGDKEAREQLISENMGLVYMTAKRFTGRGTEIEDLIQIGSIGLMKAIDYFNLSLEYSFSTYAIPMITGELKRYLRDDGLLKVSRSLKENACKTSRKREELLEKLGREPTLEEIAEEVGIQREEVIWAMEASAEVESFQKPLYQKDGSETILGDRIEEKNNANEKVLNEILVQELLDRLEEEERKLIELRYFSEMTQSQIAIKMNKTQVQVSRMEKKILNKMRMWLR